MINDTDICDDLVLSAYEDYSANTVAELLLPSGLLVDKTVQYTGSFERYVFLKGNKDEVYTRKELDFISSTGDITVFLEFHKKIRKGLIPCRVITVRNTLFDTLPFCIAFTKIINKATNGFNICVIVSEDGIIFTCRAFDNYTPNAYYISNLIKSDKQLAELYDNLVYSSDYTGFIEYYSYIREAIQYKAKSSEYLPKIRNASSSSYTYLDELQSIENSTGLDFSWQKERYLSSIEEEDNETFADKIAEADKYLFKIESSRINTMEMLFDAEEMEKLASEVEQRNNSILKQNGTEVADTSNVIDEETKALLEDPESMIKLLKKKRGI